MRLRTIVMAFALMAMPIVTFAQSEMSNEEHSKTLGAKIEVVKQEIKTLKAKLKLNSGDAESITAMTLKETELKTLKDQKKTIDEAIKAEKKSEKETKQAEKAEKKNEQASKDAEKLKEKLMATDKSNELLSDELDNKIDVMKMELKVLKEKKKADPTNNSIKAQIASQETQIKEVKRQKKTIDAAIKADKVSRKEAKQAEKALEQHEEASKKADKVKEDM